jgi:hypothetical protein
MLPRPDPSQEEVLQKFRYEPELGALYWIATRRKGRLAGCINSQGYWIVGGIGLPYRKRRAQYKAHRLIWIYHFGPIPQGFEVDHINGIRSDNHIGNLRLATSLGNSQSLKRRKDNNSGIRGVYFVPSRRRWWYQRQFAGRKILKSFRSKSEAVEYALRFEQRLREFHTRPVLNAPDKEESHGI